MLEPVAANVGVALSARCALHPEVAATHECARCGDYHCAECHKSVTGRALCATCRALPGIDYLEETRARFWGKRDGYVWYYGVFCLVVTVKVLLIAPAASERMTLVQCALWIPFSIAYLALYRPVRAGNIVYSVVTGALALGGLVTAASAAQQKVAAQLQSLGGMTALVLFTLCVTLISTLLSIAAYRSPRNKLAFRIAIDERELRRVYDTFLSNPMALRAAWYSLITAFFPLTSAITLGMGAVALRRADLSAWPPRGGRTPAIVAISASALSLLAWVTFFVWIGRVRNTAPAHI